jgi:RNA polymerase sigma factor (sigma-70 family)
MTERSTITLIQSARAGSKEAFGVLLEQHLAGAQHVARQMIGDQEIAQELMQEALLQAYLSLRSLREDERFQAWLHGIVRNVCRNYLRRQRLDDVALELDAAETLLADRRWEMADPLAALEQRELAGLSKIRRRCGSFIMNSLVCRKLLGYWALPPMPSKGGSFRRDARCRCN